MLSQAEGLHQVRLRTFALPLRDRNASELTALRLEGWNSAPPVTDGETLAVVMDSGRIELFGLNQPDNRDAPLFRLRQPAAQGRSGQEGPIRGLVVRLNGDDLTVLAGGQLQRWRSVWRSKDGGPDWIQDAAWSRRLGVPLQVPEVFEDAHGRFDLLMVTQPLDQPSALAACLRSGGKTLWQRQLGFFPRGEAVTLPGPGPSVVLVLDSAGVVHAIDVTEPQPGLRPGNLLFEVAPAGNASTGLAPFLLPGDDGASVYRVALLRRGGSTLSLTRLGRNALLLPAELGREEIRLKGALAGAPIRTPHGLVIASREQDNPIKLHLYRLGKGGEAAERTTDLENLDARTAYLTALGADRLLAADGSGTVLCLEVREDGIVRLESGQGELKGTEPRRIVAAPLVLATAPTFQVVLVDDAGGATLAESTDRGATWRTLARRDLGGRVTSGPFLLPGEGARAAFLVERRHLVVWDALAETRHWRHPTLHHFSAYADLIGLPQLSGSVLLVADESGRITALKPANLEPLDDVRTPPGTAPLTAPLTVGANRLFVPLSDGTVWLPERPR
jgi:hypothetical protein